MDSTPTSPSRTTFVVLACLLLLLGIATGIYYLPSFPGKSVLTICISGIKTWLVVWYFMRGRDTRGITVFYMCAGLVWLSLLILLVLSDYLTR